MCGFENFKDVLDVVVVPLTVFLLGALLPWWLEGRKRNRFLSLIKRELQEMKPKPPEKNSNSCWYQHLKKRFIHETIFQSPSDNRDFILSLQPDLAYNEAQLWIHYEKATKETSPDDLAEHGASWCDYLRSICNFYDKKECGLFYTDVYLPWKKLVLEYHPDLKEKGRLT